MFPAKAKEVAYTLDFYKKVVKNCSNDVVQTIRFMPAARYVPSVGIRIKTQKLCL